MITKILRSPILWLIILLFIFFIYYDFKHRSDISTMKKQLQEEVNKRVKQSDDERKTFEQNYSKDKQDLVNKLNTLQKQQSVIRNQIKESEKKVDEIKKTHLNKSDIDNLLNQYYNRPSVDTNK
jgi:septal ring factor EnvC (AmiA/AmiB activator)